MEVLYTEYLTELDLVPIWILILILFVGIACLMVGLGLMLLKEKLPLIIGIILLLIALPIFIFLFAKNNKVTNYVDYREVTIKEGYELNPNFIEKWNISRDRGKIYIISPRDKKSVKDDEDRNEQ